jgi:hypothetical protein
MTACPLTLYRSPGFILDVHAPDWGSSSRVRCDAEGKEGALK